MDVTRIDEFFGRSLTFNLFCYIQWSEMKKFSGGLGVSNWAGVKVKLYTYLWFVKNREKLRNSG